ncbi:YigZ family protein [Anaerotignum lactatifermentans]|uniref:YigZ family protein n=1 Tax=Anaerotignum lactatifermentans TaxID=160404 RepID=A0ABS2GAI5_9FIRM|nr:YigZ family protein [Anaerotignum lactatifermentans]MBM6829192.1 YigZ family protein [Anaerotignum lactatifermentans]MBM6877568.1 YigZ family protein [Anaerotignum lactatifermentans]MBM6950770.1 YigZ family protein [Anaerotignum lactatifermentans]
MLKKYKTILAQAEAEIVEKKSRFIATVRPVKTEEEARAFIDELKKKYWDATHNVFAYQLGERNEIQRFSDDGEPQGTAGMPVLNVLKGEDVKDTAIVVTRYFGGTLLGTGGLVRAYGKAAKEGLLAAGIAELVLYRRYHVTVDYTDSGKVQYEILQDGHVLYDTVYTDKVEFVVLAESEAGDAFEKKMLDIMKGREVYEMTDEVFGVWQEGQLRLMEE